MGIKVDGLNLCLGLHNKKEVVQQLLHKILGILCMQGIEVTDEDDHNILSLPGFNFEMEINLNKARTGCCVKSQLKYLRKNILKDKT
jgi:hypothetical protein